MKLKGAIITLAILCWVGAILDYQLNSVDIAKNVIRKEISTTLDNIFHFNWKQDWKIKWVKVRGKKRAYLIMPMDVTPEDKDEYMGKDIEVIWK